MKCNFFKRLLEDIKRDKVVTIVLSIYGLIYGAVVIFHDCIYKIIKYIWPKSTVPDIIILLLSTILIFIVYLLYKKYKEIDDLLFENKKYKIENENYKIENENYKIENENYKKENENYKKENEKEEEYGQIILDHNTFSNSERIRNAKNRIILHAAFYPNYITPPYSTAIDELLANQDKPKVKITVIITHPNVEWANEFQKILRKEFNDIEKDFNPSLTA